VEAYPAAQAGADCRADKLRADDRPEGECSGSALATMLHARRSGLDQILERKAYHIVEGLEAPRIVR